MNEVSLKHMCERLLHAGWKRNEIERLRQFLHTYVQTSLDEAELDSRHLEFIRWLVLHGRLSG